jgi:hypothetical protein
MNATRRVVLCLLPLVLVGCARPVAKVSGARNPFGVVDVRDPIASDVRAFEGGVVLPGGDSDINAPQWVPHATEGNTRSLEGDWYGRWEGGQGLARFRVTGDRVWILYMESREVAYVLEVVREKDRLVGRWAARGNTDGGPFVGRIVDGERIDGAWNGGRWDFRRKLK